jgi:hypothetical protein
MFQETKSPLWEVWPWNFGCQDLFNISAFPTQQTKSCSKRSFFHLTAKPSISFLLPYLSDCAFIRKCTVRHSSRSLYSDYSSILRSAFLQLTRSYTLYFLPISVTPLSVLSLRP